MRDNAVRSKMDNESTCDQIN